MTFNGKSHLFVKCIQAQPHINFTCYQNGWIGKNFGIGQSLTGASRYMFYIHFTSWKHIALGCPKCPNTEFFLVSVLPYSDWIRKFTELFGYFSRNVYDWKNFGFPGKINWNIKYLWSKSLESSDRNSVVILPRENLSNKPLSFTVKKKCWRHS